MHKDPKVLSVCHFEDENTRDSLACRLGTSNCEVIVFKFANKSAVVFPVLGKI